MCSHHSLLTPPLPPGYHVTVYERRARCGGLWDLDRLDLLQAPGPSAARPHQERFPATLVFDKYGAPMITWSRAAAAAARGEKMTPGLAEAEEAARRPPSAIYEGLRTNIPSDLMSFRDVPFPDDAPLFPQRIQVMGYLQALARKLGLEPPLPPGQRNGTTAMADAAVGSLDTDKVDMRFLTRVKTLYRSTQGRGADSVDGLKLGTKWTIVSEAVAPTEEKEGILIPGERVDVFDHVIVASGRCNTPALPFVPGLWNFRGKVLHSAWYRHPYAFAHLNVVVVGNASSGFDICREMVGKVARTLPLPEAWEKKSSPFSASLVDDVSPEAATAAWVAGCGSEAYGGRVVQSVLDYDRPPGLDFDPRDPSSPAWARRIRVVPRIDHIDPPDEGGGRSTGKIYFADGRCLEDVDVIIFATGYYYEFPFIDQTKAPFSTRPLLPLPSSKTAMVEDGIGDGHFAQETSGGYKNAVSPKAIQQLALYMQERQNGRPFHRLWPTASGLQNMDEWQLFYRYDESLAFLGMPLRIVPFPLTQVQSRYILQYWAGLSPRLTKLNPNTPPTDVNRWAYRPAPIPRSEESWAQADAAARTKVPDAPPNNLTQHDIGTPSDIRYLDGLIRHINPSAEPVPSVSGNGMGDGATRLPERWDLVPVWRQERRAHGKTLRRRELGY